MGFNPRPCSCSVVIFVSTRYRGSFAGTSKCTEPDKICPVPAAGTVSVYLNDTANHPPVPSDIVVLVRNWRNPLFLRHALLIRIECHRQATPKARSSFPLFGCEKPGARMSALAWLHGFRARARAQWRGEGEGEVGGQTGSAANGRRRCCHRVTSFVFSLAGMSVLLICL